MAVDPGLVDTYLTQVNDRLNSLKDKLATNRDRQQRVQLRIQAQSSLTQADRDILASIGFDPGDLASLQADETGIQSEIQALRNLRQAIKAL